VFTFWFFQLVLGPVHTSSFSCAEPNVNEQSSLFELICIRFGTWKVLYLNQASTSNAVLTWTYLITRSSCGCYITFTRSLWGSIVRPELESSENCWSMNWL
jgi:hypothetical protein